MQPDKLVMMANQIATFYESQPEPDHSAGTLQHIKDFWDPRMKSELKSIVATGEHGLKPLAEAAARAL